MASNAGDALMTVEELAAYIKMSPGTIYNRVSRNEIPFLKIGRSLRFRRSDIDSWLEAPAEVDSAPAAEEVA